MNNIIIYPQSALIFKKRRSLHAKMPIASRCEKSPSTFLSPSSCGFARVAALELGRRVSAELLKEEKEGQVKFCARKLQEHYKRYIELFKEQDGDFQIDLTKFRKKLPPLRDFFKSWNPRQKKEKERYLSHFSPESWSQLPLEIKKEHRLANCTGCQKREAEFQALLPVRSRQFIGIAKENVHFRSNDIKIPPVAQKRPQPFSQTDVKKIAKGLYDRVNSAFEKICEVPFAAAIAKVPELGLQKRKSPNELRKERRDRYRKAKSKIEDAWKADSLER